MRVSLVFACILAALTVGSVPARAGDLDTRAIAQALGRSGQILPGGVYKVGFPRTDLHVTVGGVVLRPALALGSYAVFVATPSGVLMLGDLVLLQSEVEPVMDGLARGGIAVTALHNHLLGEQPHVMYMHYMGRGDAAHLAATLKAALSLTNTPMVATKPKPSAGLWFQATVERALGRHGKVAGAVLAISIPRATAESMDGYALPAAMGTGEVLNFQDAGSGRIATAGDFSLTADEVGPVRQALRAHGIEVTALHTHMLSDNPHLFYMHFWSVGYPASVAAGLRAALDLVAIKP